MLPGVPERLRQLSRDGPPARPDHRQRRRRRVHQARARRPHPLVLVRRLRDGRAGPRGHRAPGGRARRGVPRRATCRTRTIYVDRRHAARHRGRARRRLHRDRRRHRQVRRGRAARGRRRPRARDAGGGAARSERVRRTSVSPGRRNRIVRRCAPSRIAALLAGGAAGGLDAGRRRRARLRGRSAQGVDLVPRPHGARPLVARRRPAVASASVIKAMLMVAYLDQPGVRGRALDRRRPRAAATR